jgi:glycosyltransferase involved in cell wall biosynthesis
MKKNRKEMQVYFKTAAPAHNFYRHQFMCPIKGVKYVPSTPTLLPQDKGTNPMVMNVKHSPLKKLAITAMKYVHPFEMTNTPFYIGLKLGDEIDGIHSAQYLLKTNKPYVVDFEEISVFAHYRQYIHTKRCKRLLMKFLLDKNCKKILPWTWAAREGMFNLLKDQKGFEELKKKTEIIYPTILPQPKIERKKHSTFNLMFLGKHFYVKGAYETILAFIEAKKTNPNIRLRVISNIMDEIKQKFGNIDGLELIQTGKELPDTYVEESYKWADAFIYPVHWDTLGFVIMEAMARGLPIISVNNFAVPEMVFDGRNGIVTSNPFHDHKDYIKAYPPVDPDTLHPLLPQIKNPPKEYVNELKDAILKLANNPKLSAKMGEESRKIIEKEHLSVGHRAKVLGRIYREAFE